MNLTRHPSLLAAVFLVACTAGPDRAADGVWVRGAEGKRLAMEPVGMVSVAPPIQEIGESAYSLAAAAPLPEIAPENHPALHNVFHLSENIISGSEPHGRDAFRLLADKGVRTILSVDGKVPDVELARKLGMRYVHVPIQYKGITEDQLAQIAKTFRELDGPFYVHCFHGKHRGPAAAAVGRLVLDGAPRERAIAEMQQWCGTSRSYEGLYRTIAQHGMPSPDATQSYRWGFPEAAPLDGVAGSMVPIARHYDHLKALAKNDWTPDATHPDVNAVHEAAQLEALFLRTNQLAEMQDMPADFRQWMEDAQRQSGHLKSALEDAQRGAAGLDLANDQLGALKRTCQACHDEFRNL